jgi:hypothetical protein
MLLRETNNIKFFLEKFNAENGTDFKIDESFTEENSPVDVLAKDSTGRIIEIQNVAYRDGTVYAQGVSNIPGFFATMVLGTAMSNEDRTASILKCIESKKNKYPSSVVKDLLLVIEVTIPSIKPVDIERLPKDFDYGFRGIYFVMLPYAMAAEEDTYGHTGYVYTLKSYQF